MNRGRIPFLVGVAIAALGSLGCDSGDSPTDASSGGTSSTGGRAGSSSANAGQGANAGAGAGFGGSGKGGAPAGGGGNAGGGGAEAGAGGAGAGSGGAAGSGAGGSGGAGGSDAGAGGANAGGSAGSDAGASGANAGGGAGSGGKAGSGGASGAGGGGSGASGAGQGGGGQGGSAGATCGNGIVDAGESCDTELPAGEPGACAVSCDDGAACTIDALQNSGTCLATCSYALIVECASGDGCCAAGCTAANDQDCPVACGNGIVDPDETCDTAIAAGQPGSCPTGCGDGKACTTDTLLNAGTCTAQCAHTAVTTCGNGSDGCCVLGCQGDADCDQYARLRQTVVPAEGTMNWYRNGYWKGSVYTDWTPWSGDTSTTASSSQSYRGVDFAVFPDKRLRQTLLTLDGKTLWYRYATWNGSGYSGWTQWSNQDGDLSGAIAGQGANQAFRSFDQIVFPDGKLKQSLLSWAGKTLWQRYAEWDGTKYVKWTAWSDKWGDLSQLIPGQGSAQTFRSFTHVVFADGRIKQAALSEDGRTVWRRYGTWNGTAFTDWTPWSNQYGDLGSLLPGQGAQQSYLSFDEAALGGVGVSTGCPNACDDGDPCTVDSCVANACQHAPLACDDGNACTTDACVGGSCQHGAVNCDDGNPCTDDSCNNGCQHSNNTASCDGGQCKDGSCQPQQTCECTFGCTDSCGKPCNDGAQCSASGGTCSNGQCVCVANECMDNKCNPINNGGSCLGGWGTCGGGKCGCIDKETYCNKIPSGTCGQFINACNGQQVSCGCADGYCCKSNKCVPGCL